MKKFKTPRPKPALHTGTHLYIIDSISVLLFLFTELYFLSLKPCMLLITECYSSLYFHPFSHKTHLISVLLFHFFTYHGHGTQFIFKTIEFVHGQ